MLFLLLLDYYQSASSTKAHADSNTTAYMMPGATAGYRATTNLKFFFHPNRNFGRSHRPIMSVNNQGELKWYTTVWRQENRTSRENTSLHVINFMDIVKVKNAITAYCFMGSFALHATLSLER